MGYIIFMVFCNLLIPVMMFSFGLLMKNHPPKDINGIYGYRTTMSMKNKDTWDFAHRHCGRLWSRWGLIMLILSIVISVIELQFNEETMAIIMLILLGVQMFFLIASIFPVEKALKENFDSNGRQKNSGIGD